MFEFRSADPARILKVSRYPDTIASLSINFFLLSDDLSPPYVFGLGNAQIAEQTATRAHETIVLRVARRLACGARCLPGQC